jgi:hypothetical protein
MALDREGFGWNRGYHFVVLFVKMAQDIEHCPSAIRFDDVIN